MRRWLVLCEVLFVSRPPDWQASIFLCLLWWSQLKRCLVSSAPGGVVCCQVDATTKQASFKRQPAKDGALPTVRYLARTVANNYFHINQSVNYLFYIFFLNCPSHFQNPIQGVDSNVLVSVQWEKTAGSRADHICWTFWCCRSWDSTGCCIFKTALCRSSVWLPVWLDQLCADWQLRFASVENMSLRKTEFRSASGVTLRRQWKRRSLE